jgi:hypothetical protein
MIICKYRNCCNVVDGRPNKKYCKIQCKRNELKYLQREKAKDKEIKSDIDEI